MRLYAIDVSFAKLTDKAERDYLNNRPTSLPFAGRGCRSLARRWWSILLAWPEFQRLARLPVFQGQK